VRVRASWEPLQGADFYRVTVHQNLLHPDGTRTPRMAYVYECPTAYRGGEPARTQIDVTFECPEIYDENIGGFFVTVMGFNHNRNLAVEVASSQWSLEYGHSVTYNLGTPAITYGYASPKFTPEFIPMNKRCIRG